jgi:adenylate cyclase
MFLARRMVVPIHALRAGAARLGSGDLGQRIAIKTGDEVEALANQFNDMAGRLQESYANLERKVEERTQELHQRTDELGRSVGELRALGEVSQAVNSTLDLETVLSTIVARRCSSPTPTQARSTSSTREKANFACTPHMEWMRS